MAHLISRSGFAHPCQRSRANAFHNYLSYRGLAGGVHGGPPLPSLKNGQRVRSMMGFNPTMLRLLNCKEAVSAQTRLILHIFAATTFEQNNRRNQKVRAA